tara:strand:- start:148 stop:381 length:234 start_codon:yes stop_codon:yes gene_type:complete
MYTKITSINPTIIRKEDNQPLLTEDDLKKEFGIYFSEIVIIYDGSVEVRYSTASTTAKHVLDAEKYDVVYTINEEEK